MVFCRRQPFMTIETTTNVGLRKTSRPTKTHLVSSDHIELSIGSEADDESHVRASHVGSVDADAYAAAEPGADEHAKHHIALPAIAATGTAVVHEATDA